ncbi:MAG: HAD family hydrolase [Marinosulfonomonas sp.]
MKNIVFDIGNVLIAWDAHAAFRDAFEDDAAIDDFLEKVGFYAWNLEQDRGRSRADAIASIQADHPDHARLLIRFFDRFPDTIQQKITESWEVLADLKSAGHRVFGLTNWGAETWPMAKIVHPELNHVFEDVIVSGEEKMIKPDARIYELLTRRNNLVPADCLFIDDSLKNVEGAQSVGWMAHHFTNAKELRRFLSDIQIL